MRAINIVTCVLVGLVAGCSTQGKAPQIRELAPEISRNADSNVTILGFDRLFSNGSAKNVNVMFVHGIGWTEDPGKKEFGEDLIEFLKGAYGAERTIRSTIKEEDGNKSCASGKNGELVAKGVKRFRVDEVKRSLYSDDPNIAFSIGAGANAGCLYRDVLTLSDQRTITIFRFIWDNALWNAYEYPHMGYDDSAISKLSDTDKTLYDARKGISRKLKDQVVTFGLSDAALYIGPLGEVLRNGMRGAICAAIVNGADANWTPGDIGVETQCNNIPTFPAPLVLMSHSLGSRLLFDVLKTDLTPGLEKLIDSSITNRDLEVYLLANQIPLIGLGRLGPKKSDVKYQSTKLTFVALSEINDLLTYELIPYFIQLNCSRSLGCDKWRASMVQSKAGEQMAKGLGFNIVDVRAEFAGPFKGVIPSLADPEVAHSGHLLDPGIRELILCGTDDKRGAMRGDGVTIRKTCRP